MKALIEHNISWSEIGKHPKENYHYAIEKAVVSKETTVLSVDIRLNFIIPFSDVIKIKSSIQNEVNGLKGCFAEFYL